MTYVQDRMTQPTDWADVQAAMMRLSELTHGRPYGYFGNMAADAIDEARYPRGLAGVARYQDSVTRVYCALVESHDHLAPVAGATRRMVHVWRVVGEDGSHLTEPMRSHRAAAWVRTNRGLVGEVRRVPSEEMSETREHWEARCMAAVDAQLRLESVWREAQDALNCFCGSGPTHPSERWFDPRAQASRRLAAEAIIHARCTTH